MGESVGMKQRKVHVRSDRWYSWGPAVRGATCYCGNRRLTAPQSACPQVLKLLNTLKTDACWHPNAWSESAAAEKPSPTDTLYEVQTICDNQVWKIHDSHTCSCPTLSALFFTFSWSAVNKNCQGMTVWVLDWTHTRWILLTLLTFNWEYF